jgi:isoquinoline 1-oxidoreductase beta subunit
MNAFTKFPSRRAVLRQGLAGSLLLAFHLPAGAVNEPEQPPDDVTGKFAPNAFIRIAPDGTTILVMPQVEMGQGVYTAIAMILAEELDADYSKLVLVPAPPNDKLYGNPLFGIQVTGNSNSIRAFWKTMRTAGATGRAMLVAAAAKRWNVDPASCTAAGGTVRHAASGRELGYGALVAEAARIVPPKTVPLKDPKDFTIIGKSKKRFDTPNKVDGKTIYGIDAMLPGMKFATLVSCPVFGGKVGKVDDTAAKRIPGIQKIVVLDDMVGVVGDHMWAAKQGRDALKIAWEPGAGAQVSSSEVWDQLRAASAKDGVVAKSVGDAAKVLSQGDRYDAAYELPFLAHATMEPMNCTVLCKPDSCEIWIGTQVMTRVQQTVAKLLNLPADKVTVHNHMLGGGFGRRLEPDMALASVRIAREMQGVPVKVIWMREEDMQHDVYRPAYRDVIAATVSDGRINGWKYKVAGSSVMARWLPPAFQKGIDIDAVDSAVDIPYDIPHLQVEYVRAEPATVPTGFWRGVGPNNNVFAIESFMDELARRAKKDPVAFRLNMLGKNPRLKAALELAAQKAGWGKSLPPRVGLGVSVQPSFGSFIATVVEAEIAPDGEVILRHVTSAVDTGIAVNPDTIVAQLQGGLIFGLTAALYGEITIKDGRVQQSNFNDYRMLRINQAPTIDVHVIKSDEAPGGIGETGVTAGPPALRNAIYAATGIALRKLPIDRAALSRKTA